MAAAGVSAAPGTCRGCDGTLPAPFLDFGDLPMANAFLRPEHATAPDPRFPLAVAHCPACHLVQLTVTAPPETLFADYLYFSSYSDRFVAHAAAMAASLARRFRLGPGRPALEIASNDGCLLEAFQRLGVPVLGVEPARNVAAVARERGVPTLSRFFDAGAVDEVVARLGRPRVIVGNNVLAHVPDINGFLAAVAACLHPDGAAVFEVPHLGELLARGAFDTIYHEHVFYYSLTALRGLAARAGLEVFDVLPQAIHGGSLRVFLQRQGAARAVAGAIDQTVAAERAAGLTDPARFAAFSDAVQRLRAELPRRLRSLKAGGRRLAAYGAPAKGTILLNACGIGTDLLEFTVDRSPHKQGLLVPGVRLPIRPPGDLLRAMPDFTLLLSWNFADEILVQQADYLAKGGAFIVPVPAPRIVGADDLP